MERGESCAKARDFPARGRCTYQEEHLAVGLDLVFFHVLYEATVGVSAKHITITRHWGHSHHLFNRKLQD